jgi:hypothetical protein
MRLREGQRVRLLHWWRLPVEERTGRVVEARRRLNPMVTVRLDSGELVTATGGNFEVCGEDW